jgi:hypothetical protein
MIPHRLIGSAPTETAIDLCDKAVALLPVDPDTAAVRIRAVQAILRQAVPLPLHMRVDPGSALVTAVIEHLAEFGDGVLFTGAARRTAQVMRECLGLVEGTGDE